MTSGSQSVGVELAFNTIGWERSNLLFAALDALLGDPLISIGVRRPAAGADRGVDHRLDDRRVRRRHGDADLDGAHHGGRRATPRPRRRRRSWARAG